MSDLNNFTGFNFTKYLVDTLQTFHILCIKKIYSNLLESIVKDSINLNEDCTTISICIRDNEDILKSSLLNNFILPNFNNIDRFGFWTKEDYESCFKILDSLNKAQNIYLCFDNPYSPSSKGILINNRKDIDSIIKNMKYIYSFLNLRFNIFKTIIDSFPNTQIKLINYIEENDYSVEPKQAFYICKYIITRVLKRYFKQNMCADMLDFLYAEKPIDLLNLMNEKYFITDLIKDLERKVAYVTTPDIIETIYHNYDKFKLLSKIKES